MEIRIFPNNQLGGDTDMLAQVRSGGIEMFTPSALVVSTLAPSVAINAVGFAFNDYNQVWAAMDGKLGAYVRAAMQKAGLESFEKMWDNGFRQTTTSNGPITSAQTMRGLKIRVPVSPLSIDMFRGSAPHRPVCNSAKCIRRCKHILSMRRKIRCLSCRSQSSTKCRSTAH